MATTSTELDQERAQLLQAWMDAVARQEPTGDCPDPACPGKLRPRPAPLSTGGVLWLEAECDECGRDVAFPDGRRKVASRPGPLAQVHRATLQVRDEGGVRVPDWHERAIGTDW